MARNEGSPPSVLVLWWFSVTHWDLSLLELTCHLIYGCDWRSTKKKDCCYVLKSKLKKKCKNVMGHQRISIIENPVFWGQEKVGAGHSFLALHSGAAFIVAYFSPTCSLLHLRLPILVTRHAAQLETLFLANTMPTRMFGAVSSLCSYFFLFLSLLTDAFVAAGEIEFFLDVTWRVPYLTSAI